MAMGMSYEQYWDGETGIHKAFREAYRLRQRQQNEQMWLQGAYVYDAVARLSPILNGFVKRPKAEPYPKEPYALYEEEKPEPETPHEQEKLVASSRDAFLEMLGKLKRKKGSEDQDAGRSDDRET